MGHLWCHFGSSVKFPGEVAQCFLYIFDFPNYKSCHLNILYTDYYFNCYQSYYDYFVNSARASARASDMSSDSASASTSCQLKS